MNRKRALIADTFCLTKRRRCAADSVTGESQGKTLFLICNQVDILLLLLFFSSRYYSLIIVSFGQYCFIPPRFVKKKSIKQKYSINLG